jgi:hypothetical protein
MKEDSKIFLKFLLKNTIIIAFNDHMLSNTLEIEEIINADEEWHEIKFHA